MTALKTAIIGAGIIGRTHVETMKGCTGLDLCAIVDPNPAAEAIARDAGAAFFETVDALLQQKPIEAVVIASPNDTHVPIARRFLEAGIPVLLEKPVAKSLTDALELAEVEAKTGTPILIGHHRRHNPIIKAAKSAIAVGEIGDLVTANVNSTLMKPAPYFDIPWRGEKGQGGPLLINLIHEVDMLRHFFGEVAEVQGLVSNARRGLAVEDTGAAILSFRNGGVASLSITDAGCGPWAWDISAGENRKRFPAHDVFAHAYAGTKAGLSLPDLSFWQHPGTPDWTEEMRRVVLPHQPGNPYIAQLDHFAAVSRREVAPLVTLADGIGNMAVVAAIAESAEKRCPVTLKEGLV